MPQWTLLIVRIPFTTFVFASTEFKTSAISLEGNAEHERDLFTTGYKVVATFRGQLKSLPHACSTIMRFLVDDKLKLAIPSFDTLTTPAVYDRSRRLLRPPSSSRTSSLLMATMNFTNSLPI